MPLDLMARQAFARPSRLAGVTIVQSRMLPNAAGSPVDHLLHPRRPGRLKGTQVTRGITILLPDGAAASNFYFSRAINDQVTIGLGIFTPFGAKLDYKKGLAGRYGIQSANQETVNFNLSISFRFNEHHRIGFGVSAQYIKSVQRGAADVKSLVGQYAGR